MPKIQVSKNLSPLTGSLIHGKQQIRSGQRAQGIQIAGIDRSGMDIGAIPCGDVMVALFVILLGCILMKFKKSPFETMMRKFEKKFI